MLVKQNFQYKSVKNSISSLINDVIVMTYSNVAVGSLMVTWSQPDCCKLCYWERNFNHENGPNQWVDTNLLTVFAKWYILDVWHGSEYAPGHLSKIWLRDTIQPAFTCSKLTIETLEQGLKYVQS